MNLEKLDNLDNWVAQLREFKELNSNCNTREHEVDSNSVDIIGSGTR